MNVTLRVGIEERADENVASSDQLSQAKLIMFVHCDT